MAARPEPETAVPVPRYTINLSANAAWLLLRCQLANDWQWMNPFCSIGLLPGSQNRAGPDLTAFMKILLLNDQNRYDDENPVPRVKDEELVRRSLEWLRGVEKAKKEDKLGNLPHLYDP